MTSHSTGGLLRIARARYIVDPGGEERTLTAIGPDTRGGTPKTVSGRIRRGQCGSDALGGSAA